MRARSYRCFDPLLADGDAMLRLAERFGRYGTYDVERIEGDIDEGLAQRHDHANDFVRTGGRLSRREDLAPLAARTSCFRELYACAEPLVEGVEPFLHCKAFIEAARELYGHPVIRPHTVYASLLVPGQELAVHTDVPEFRGIHPKKDPAWLVVAMHHSGLFDAWRIPIATGVAWFGSCRGGGDFAFYPDGPFERAVALPARHNTAILLDTDSVFHGVDRVSESRVPMPPLHPGMQLAFAGDGRWRLHDGESVVAEYDWDDLRFSISWKAACYRDEDEERAAQEHIDDLTRERVLEVLLDDLRSRGRVGAETPSGNDLALEIIEAYIQLPPPAPQTPERAARAEPSR